MYSNGETDMSMYDVKPARLHNCNVLIMIATCMVCRNNLKTEVSKLYIELQANSHDKIGIQYIKNIKCILR